MKNGNALLREAALGMLAAMSCIGLECTSSGLTDTWMDPSFTGPPMTSMLVIAVKRSAVSRRIWEDGLVAALSSHGVTAIPSYRLYPNAPPDTQQVVAAVQDHHCDGVLLIRRLPTQRTTYDRPGSVQQLSETRYDKLRQTYYTVYHDVYEPGFTDTLKVMRHEVELLSTKATGQLVWAGTGESLDPTSREAVRGEITGMIVPELARLGLIPAE